MRILDKESLSLHFATVSFRMIRKFSRCYFNADGIFLVTGPTGSGKSIPSIQLTNAINKPDRRSLRSGRIRSC